MNENKTANLLPCDGQLILHNSILDTATSLVYFEMLLESIPWRSDEVFIYGKKIVTKRKMAWFALDDLNYTYSGITRSPEAFTKELIELKVIAESYCNDHFNACLLNLYHSGNEGMGWHSDNESSIVKGSTIASISLGEARPFQLRHKKSGDKVQVLLENGSLLLMLGSTQEHWQHSLPKTPKVKGPRINLTFRKMVTGQHQSHK